MAELTDRRELNDRLDLIENMIAEGRRATEQWGWNFVLWGVAYYVAIAWTEWGHATIAWPVTMTVAGVITGIVARRKSFGPSTTVGRSMAAIWRSTGISLFIFGLFTSISGHGGSRVIIAGVAIMLGMANAASSSILRWKVQFACAVVWWAAGVAMLFSSVEQSWVIFLVAIFLCQIVFGVYMMICEGRGQRLGGQAGVSHA